MRPFVKWIGGKARIAKRIDQAFGQPCEGTYFEPFLGGGSVFLYRRKRGQILGPVTLSDCNTRLVATWKAVQLYPYAVANKLQRLPGDSMPWQSTYYAVRRAFNETEIKSTPEFAALFLWLNRSCYNGLYRESKKGVFNAPIGQYKTRRMPTAADLAAVARALDGVTIVRRDFRECLLQAGEGDQMYLDPPYLPYSRTADFVAYNAAGFTLDDQRAVAGGSHWAGFNGAIVVISNHDTLACRALYRRFEIVDSFEISRTLSPDGTAKARELIARFQKTFKGG